MNPILTTTVSVLALATIALPASALNTPIEERVHQKSETQFRKRGKEKFGENLQNKGHHEHHELRILLTSKLQQPII